MTCRLFTPNYYRMSTQAIQVLFSIIKDATAVAAPVLLRLTNLMILMLLIRSQSLSECYSWQSCRQIGPTVIIVESLDREE